MIRFYIRYFILFLFLVGIVYLPNGHATSVLSFPSVEDRMYSCGRDGIIFSGEVSYVHAGYNEVASPITEYCFLLEEVIKDFTHPQKNRPSVSGDTVCYQFYGNADAGIVRGMPKFHKGDRGIVMLYAPSQAGLTSPCGLSQGVLRYNKIDGRDLVGAPDLHLIPAQHMIQYMRRKVMGQD